MTIKPQTANRKPQTANRKPQTANRKAFSLIESAIVLGVVGLVIGVIWVAAATLSENIKVNRTKEGLVLLFTNMYRVLPPGTTATGYGFLDARSLGILPPQFVPMNGVTHYGHPASKGGVNEWGGGVLAYWNGQGATAVYPNGDLVVFLYNLPKSACYKLVTAMSAAFKAFPTDGHLPLIALAGNGVTFSETVRATMPLSPSQTGVLCPYTKNDIEFATLRW